MSTAQKAPVLRDLHPRLPGDLVLRRGMTELLREPENRLLALGSQADVP